ncbi:rod shape-determining protein [Algivirga pacifica]|uniref:Cell shape-determining protein MreB n=1 Tax=Algivirga pacifica TaxID=1162670 RepID=A0ABP9D985_9BACT
MGLFDFFTTDLAIDLGTANTLILNKGKVVVEEPSIIALNQSSGKVIAVGEEAMRMHEKTHHFIKTVRPLRDGVIADFHAAEQMIRTFIKKSKLQGRFMVSSHRMVICVPSGITEVEKRAVRDSAEHAGAKEVYMIPEPVAAAIGLGIDIQEPTGSMVVDIGGGTSEIAIIALSGIVCDESLRIAGDIFNRDILDYMRRQHNLLIGERTAEQIKFGVGSAITELDDEPEDYVVKGRDLITGVPKIVEVSYKEVAFALDKSLTKVEEAIFKALEAAPPELSADIYDRGIHLTGGGALLRGLDKRISLKTKLPVHIADDPLRTVLAGTAEALVNLQQYKSVLLY